MMIVIKMAVNAFLAHKRSFLHIDFKSSNFVTSDPQCQMKIPLPPPSPLPPLPANLPPSEPFMISSIQKWKGVLGHNSTSKKRKKAKRKPKSFILFVIT